MITEYQNRVSNIIVIKQPNLRYMNMDNEYKQVKTRSGKRTVILQFPKKSKESDEIRKSICQILSNELRRQIRMQ